MAEITNGDHGWRFTGAVPASIYEDIAGSPGFQPAIRHLAGGLLALGDADPSLGRIFRDAGRYVAAMCAAALQDEGVTLPRLKELCAGFGLLSGGRVRALLLFLRYLGFVALWSERGRGQATYIVSPEFLAVWRNHYKVALEAAALVDPSAAKAVARIDGDDFFAAFCRLHMVGLQTTGSAEAGTDLALFRVFLNRLGGIQILYMLLLQGDGECPPRSGLRLAVVETARRLEVSRMHVDRMLRDAEAEGLITRSQEGVLFLTDLACAQMRLSYAIQFAHLLVAGAMAEQAAP